MRIILTGGSGFIGTNLVFSLEQKNHKNILNIDIQSPLNDEHLCYYKRCNILNRKDLFNYFKIFQPTHVIHLAAMTDTSPDLILEKDYLVNTQGTQNVLDAINQTETIKRVIIVSTQYVCKPGYLPKHDLDHTPFTTYGVSKSISEQITHNSELKCCWTIVRPVNIWGPWHFRYKEQFLKVLKNKLYFHPKNIKVIRTYGFVENIVYQLFTIFNVEEKKINGKTFYIGDKPDDIYKWVNEFSLQMNGKPVNQLKLFYLKFIAFIGSVCSIFGIRFPLTLNRLNSMTTEYIVPTMDTIKLLGPNPNNLKDGVKKTLEWLKENEN